MVLQLSRVAVKERAAGGRCAVWSPHVSTCVLWRVRRSGRAACTEGRPGAPHHGEGRTGGAGRARRPNAPARAPAALRVNAAGPGGWAAHARGVTTLRFPFALFKLSHSFIDIDARLSKILA
ncbi:hypothetical protein EVAR_42499_1 [Eumeta japonica]|uniref:Uncharacterized protein n=1 Tax=Eumeta variegata TaxID=151549 RepID=A0A4C1XGQ6_EUMVA|nr:hypothetical protein EVAR_42499_1 [Eumeta japonica]